MQTFARVSIFRIIALVPEFNLTRARVIHKKPQSMMIINCEINISNCTCGSIANQDRVHFLEFLLNTFFK